ncbi:MAG: Hsp20/alpha crystallin family protein [Candidatus Omnitrophica bacterium]|nr:Hsp20/alpha crystallin family protein [Candidatus Omnitrophota bacterium]
MALITWRPRQDWWDPFADLERIQREMNRLFNLTLAQETSRHVGLLDGAWIPAIDIYDSKDNLLVKADIPGLTKDDIEVTVQGDTLFIKGEKKQDKDIKEKDYIRTERFYGAFQRAIRLPVEVQADKVEATYKNGVLEVVLPKSEKAKPKQIKLEIK